MGKNKRIYKEIESETRSYLFVRFNDELINAIGFEKTTLEASEEGRRTEEEEKRRVTEERERERERPDIGM